MGVHVVPEFFVFHTPPEPTATYHTLLLFGSIEISAIRPERNAGPTFLNLKALSEMLSLDFWFLTFDLLWECRSKD